MEQQCWWESEQAQQIAGGWTTEKQRRHDERQKQAGDRESDWLEAADAATRARRDQFHTVQHSSSDGAGDKCRRVVEERRQAGDCESNWKQLEHQGPHQTRKEATS